MSRMLGPVEWGERPHRRCRKRERNIKSTYLILGSESDVNVVGHIYGIPLGAVDDVGHALAVHHDAMVVARVGGYEDAIAGGVVRCYEALAGAEVGGGESGDGSALVLEGAHYS